MTIARKRIGEPKKVVEVIRRGFPALAGHAVHMLDILYWAHERALSVRNLDLSPLHVAILRRARTTYAIRFHEVANWTRATKPEMSRAAKYLAKLELIELAKSSHDPRVKLIKLTSKGREELKQVDRAFEADLAVLVKTAPLFYSKRKVRFTSQLMRADRYLPWAGVAEESDYGMEAEDIMPTLVEGMADEEFERWMSPDFSYDPRWKAGKRKRATKKDEEPPF